MWGYFVLAICAVLYQNILDDDAPFRAFLSGMSGFPAHRHADLELAFCLAGEFSVLLDRVPFTVGEGELLLVSPAVLHEIPASHSPDRRVLTVMLGPSLLREDFAPFRAAAFPRPVLRPEMLPGGERLAAALADAAALAGATAPGERLSLLSALFAIAAHLLAALDGGDTPPARGGITGIEPALELVWHGYRAPLTVEEAAAATGYGKSNFCKLFRTVTGETFHRALNRRRIRAACDLLVSTDLPIAAIGAEVGLPEPKTFSRVFREIEGMTPGAYRLSRA